MRSLHQVSQALSKMVPHAHACAWQHSNTPKHHSRASPISPSKPLSTQPQPQVDDMVASNPILYAPGEHPDHVVVIKYVPYVADSKRAMDEYTSEIFMGGHNTIVMHNTCEDSLLAAPIILDLVILAGAVRSGGVRGVSVSPL